jgi:hypothetical protein
MKNDGHVKIQIQVFLNSAVGGNEWSASCIGRFTPEERVPRYPLDRGLAGLQTSAERS